MSEPVNFTSSIDLPDGRSIYVSVAVPADHAAGLSWEYTAENAEIAQMAVAQVLRLMLRGDKSRAERAAEDAEDNEVAF